MSVVATSVDLSTWLPVGRPGYFGRKRDMILRQLDAKHGAGNWTLAWVTGRRDDLLMLGFEAACRTWYEESYFQHLVARPGDVDLICAYEEVIDNAESNVQSGLDYAKQEAFSTHIQDIAVRNVLARLGRRFEGVRRELLVIRGPETTGYQWSPGLVSFVTPRLITQPSLAPPWAQPNSVEDFWQSNKWVLRRRGARLV